MKHILVPIGISPDAHQTLQYAVDFAEQFDSRVYVMEVFNVSVGAGKSLANVTKKSSRKWKRTIKGSN
ncbi:universal stress protein [Zobellia nedashkovskayae]